MSLVEASESFHVELHIFRWRIQKHKRKTVHRRMSNFDTDEFGKSKLLSSSVEGGDEKVPPFLDRQKNKLLQFRDSLLDLMTGVSRDTLRSRAEDNEASGLGMHQADAGSDAYDRDFALNLLSQEQDALYEIEEALKRVDAGTYGICEMSGKPIP
jgi:DnaK suppressor protein